MSTSASPQRGAAMLLAMIILMLVTTLTAGMVWQQHRAVQVESAERARAQAGWILNGALDWARLILREDEKANQQRRRNGQSAYDGLDEPWATPLAEARLSTFLAADKDNNADSGPEAFLSGTIVDAQSRWNLRGLVDGAGKVIPAELAGLRRLAQSVGAPSDAADRIATVLQSAWAPPTPENQNTAVIPPAQLSDLVWLGIEARTVERLAAVATILPLPSPVNVNTASREAIAAALEGVDLGTAERLVQQRQRKPFESLAAVNTQLPPTLPANERRLSVTSRWFEVAGRMRLEERVLEERSLVERQDSTGEVVVRRRERLSLSVTP
jgi:general secretion pathway protein K